MQLVKLKIVPYAFETSFFFLLILLPIFFLVHMKFVHRNRPILLSHLIIIYTVDFNPNICVTPNVLITFRHTFMSFRRKKEGLITSTNCWNRNTHIVQSDVIKKIVIRLEIILSRKRELITCNLTFSYLCLVFVVCIHTYIRVRNLIFLYKLETYFKMALSELLICWIRLFL